METPSTPVSAAVGGRILRRFLGYVPELQIDAPDLYSHLSTILTVLDPSGPPIGAREPESHNPPDGNADRVLGGSATAGGDAEGDKGEPGEQRNAEAATPTALSGGTTDSAKKKKKKKAAKEEHKVAVLETQDASAGTEKTPKKKKRKSLDAAGSGEADGLRQEETQVQEGPGEASIGGAEAHLENGVSSEPSSRKKKTEGQGVKGAQAGGSSSKETDGSSVKAGATQENAGGSLQKAPDSIKKKKKKVAVPATD